MAVGRQNRHLTTQNTRITASSGLYGVISTSLGRAGRVAILPKPSGICWGFSGKGRVKGRSGRPNRKWHHRRKHPIYVDEKTAFAQSNTTSRQRPSRQQHMVGQHLYCSNVINSKRPWHSSTSQSFPEFSIDTHAIPLHKECKKTRADKKH